MSKTLPKMIIPQYFSYFSKGILINLFYHVMRILEAEYIYLVILFKTLFDVDDIKLSSLCSVGQ